MIPGLQLEQLTRQVGNFAHTVVVDGPVTPNPGIPSGPGIPSFGS